MPRVRTIPRNPPKAKRNFFVVDASFLAEKYIPVGSHPTPEGKERGRECKKWWKEIDRQIKLELARVYVPDVCIAEAFKALAKKYYQDKVLKNSSQYKYARKRLSEDITLSHKVLKQQKRYIRYHDVESCRDIIIAVDRFYELFLKQKKSVGIVDLILVATAKYLMDFHDAPRPQLHIITLDKPLWQGIKKITELPNAYDPQERTDAFERVFKGGRYWTTCDLTPIANRTRFMYRERGHWRNRAAAPRL